MSITGNTSFLDFAAIVLDQRERDGIRGAKRERSRFKCHIANATFATKPLIDVGRPDISEWLRTMTVKLASDTRGERVISNATIKRSSALVSAVFAEAVDRELIPQNPCFGVKLKRKDHAGATKEKWGYLTPDEQRAIVKCEAISEPDRLMIEFAFRTGLRQGEQYHLELADLIVDGDRPRVVVRYGSEGKATKSGKIREVPLSPDAVKMCRRWLAVLPTFCPHNPAGLVWPNARVGRRLQGKPLGRSGTLSLYLKTAGITKHLRWHDLRHTAASSLVAGWWGRRWSIHEVQKILGHSSVTITERYAHLADSVLHDAARETVIASTAPISSRSSFAKRIKRRLAHVVDAIRRAS